MRPKAVIRHMDTSSHQLLQHKRQYPALVVILNFNRRIDAQFDRNTLAAAVGAVNHQRHILLRNDAFEVVGLGTVELQ